MSWAMRYTFHAGYEPPAMRPQFASTLGTDDPVAHIRYAADQGMAGVLYAWAADRPAAEVAAVAAALAETGLHGSCVLSAPMALLFTPFWTDRSRAGRARLAQATEQACQRATALRTGVLAAFIMADPARADDPAQTDDTIANLGEMAALAGDHGLVLGIEPMVVPGLMLQRLAPTLEVIRAVGRRDLGLIYDTGHVALMEGSLMPGLQDSFDEIVLLQLADQPGRVEPGAGTLDLVAVAAEAIRRGYAGLVDLEHGWLDLSREGEANGLARLRRFDDAVRQAVRAPQAAPIGEPA